MSIKVKKTDVAVKENATFRVGKVFNWNPDVGTGDYPHDVGGHYTRGAKYYQCESKNKPVSDATGLLYTPSEVLCYPIPPVSISGKVFCLTGEFAVASRKDLENAIISKGGIVKSAVTRSKTDFLVVGRFASEFYGKQGVGGERVGMKIRTAVEWRDSGKSKIAIISGATLLESLNSVPHP